MRKIVKIVEKASWEGPGALLDPLGRYFATTDSQSAASGTIWIAEGEARRVPKGGQDKPREAQEAPKSVFFSTSILRCMIHQFLIDFLSIFIRFWEGFWSQK